MRARVVAGKWVLDDPADLPEGTEVEIVTRPAPPKVASGVYVDENLRAYVHAVAAAAGVPTYSENEIVELAREHAHSRGRAYVTPEDVKAAAPPVLARSVVVPSDARAKGMTADLMVRAILDNTPIP